VLARVLAFGADLADARTERELWQLASELLPTEDIETYTQGLMDLGATVCLARAPLCLLCPVRDECVAARTGTQDRYPVKSRRPVRGRRDNVWLELRRGEAIWLVEREPSGVWAGLWSLPEFDSIADLEAVTIGWPGNVATLVPFVHVLTHFDWHLQPLRWTFPAHASARTLAPLAARWPRGRWFALDAALALGLPAPLRKRLEAELAASALSAARS